MLKLQDNPSPLLPGIERPSQASGEWRVAHTKPRSEKAFAWDLTERGVAYYLPMARRTQVSGGRRRTTLLPLFPSYVFFCGDDDARLQALTTNRVCHVLPVRHQQTLVQELDAVHLALSLNGELAICPHVAVGRRCRVARGPMRGVEGTVVNADNVYKVVLTVSMIGQSAALEINGSDLEEAD